MTGQMSSADSTVAIECITGLRECKGQLPKIHSAIISHVGLNPLRSAGRVGGHRAKAGAGNLFY